MNQSPHMVDFLRRRSHDRDVAAQTLESDRSSFGDSVGEEPAPQELPEEEQLDMRLGPRAEKRTELRVEIGPKDLRLVRRLRKDLDCSAAHLVRSALRELGLRMYGASR
jgi:hypothetical protein